MAATFNLYRTMKRDAAEIPNGTGIANVPSGSDFGNSQGVQLSDGAGGVGDPSGVGAAGGAGGEMGEPAGNKVPLREIIGDILCAAARGATPEEISTIAKKAMNTDLPQELVGNDSAFKMVIALGRRASEDPNKMSVNPETGIQEQSLDQLASNIAAQAGWETEELIKEGEERQVQQGSQQPQPVVQASVRLAEGKPDIHEAPKGKKNEQQDPLKKKKRGSPFKVLMGRVQKMLDHGMGKREIVKKLKGTSWKAETVTRCVDIVKDYNRRNKRTEQKEQPEEGKESKSFNLLRTMQKSAANYGERPGFKYEQDSAKRESIYDIERDPRMQSNMELLTRMMYLKNAAGFDSRMSNENAGGMDVSMDKSKVNSQLRGVMNELKRRQYTDADLTPLVEVAGGSTKEEG